MLALLLLAFGLPDASDVYARSLQADAANRQRMVVYLFREQITQRTVDPAGRELSRTYSIYEVQMVNGRLVHRLVERDGPAATAPSHRRVYAYSRLGALHSLKVVGESVEDGRSCWLLQGKPRLFARARDEDERRLARSLVTVWIDKETFNRVRMDVMEKSEPGESVSFHFAPRDEDVWLVTAIRIRIPQGRNVRIGEQVYSNYRRFSSDSTVTVVP